MWLYADGRSGRQARFQGFSRIRQGSVPGACIGVHTRPASISEVGTVNKEFTIIGMAGYFIGNAANICSVSGNLMNGSQQSRFGNTMP